MAINLRPKSKDQIFFFFFFLFFLFRSKSENLVQQLVDLRIELAHLVKVGFRDPRFKLSDLQVSLLRLYPGFFYVEDVSNYGKN